MVLAPAALLALALADAPGGVATGLLAGLFGKVSLPGQHPQGGRKPRVSPDLVAPELWVVCSPITRSTEGPSDVRTISLVAGRRAVPALRMETSRELYQDKFGFTYPALGMTTVFPLSAAQPGGEVDVLYSGGEDTKVRLDLTGVR